MYTYDTKIVVSTKKKTNEGNNENVCNEYKQTLYMTLEFDVKNVKNLKILYANC